MAGNQTPYYGTIPNIAKAFENDPRTKLAQLALQQGTSVAPVAQGGWGVTDGLARAAQAITGALMNKSQEKRYAAREATYTDGLKDAAALASTPQPTNPGALAPPGMAGAASALGGQPAPMQTFDPGPSSAPPQGGPQANMAPPAPMAPAPGLGAPMGAPAPGLGGGMAPPRPPVTAASMYRSAIRPIEGGTDPRTGAFRTSPKGAVGPGQIMPKTAPEAARLAGLPYDEKRFRTDASYNDALGQAYFQKKLADFGGDPLKAAAAYNAGTGRVNRAIRKAVKLGGDWTDHIPSETQGYVQKFAAKIGGGEGGLEATQVAPTPVAAPVMEAVPQGPAQTSAGPVATPNLPAEVQSNRIAMAQQMLQSGNPDMVVMAQAYLDKGLDEQNTARNNAATQQFEQGQTGYRSNLEMRNTGVAADRTNAYQDRREATSRNFDRETLANNQTFTAGENAANRNFQGSESAADRNFRGSQNGLDRSAQRSNLEYSEMQQNGRTDKTIEGRRLTAQEKATQDKNVYYSTPTGLKMQAEAAKTVQSNDETIGKLQRYMQLNDKVDTGGVTGMLPGRSLFDKDFAEMDSLAKDTTLGKIGGSLGTAISDGDRKFIEGANVNPRNPRQANRNIAQATINALRRKSEQALAFGDAQASGVSQRTFLRQWRNYVNETSVYVKDKNGNVTDQYVPFDVWQQAKAGQLRRVK